MAFAVIRKTCYGKRTRRKSLLPNGTTKVCLNLLALFLLLEPAGSWAENRPFAPKSTSKGKFCTQLDSILLNTRPDFKHSP